MDWSQFWLYWQPFSSYNLWTSERFDCCVVAEMNIKPSVPGITQEVLMGIRRNTFSCYANLLQRTLKICWLCNETSCTLTPFSWEAAVLLKTAPPRTGSAISTRFQTQHVFTFKWPSNPSVWQTTHYVLTGGFRSAANCIFKLQIVPGLLTLTLSSVFCFICTEATGSTETQPIVIIHNEHEHHHNDTKSLLLLYAGSTQQSRI